MFVLVRVSEGLLISHICLIVWFLVGASVYPWFRQNDPSSAPVTMLKVVSTCALGVALYGFSEFALAVAGLLNPVCLAMVPLAWITAGSLYWHESPLHSKYWEARLAAISGAWNFPLLTTYYALIALAFPAVILNFGGSDPVAYHLAYAMDWSQAHRLTIDPFLRTPFYASNFVLLFAAFMAFHIGHLVNFLTWSMSLLSALAICAAAIASFQSKLDAFPASVIGLALSLSVVLAPFYLRWNDTAYIDVSIGAFALFSTLCFMLAGEQRRLGWLLSGAVVAGFLIGMKGSFATLVPPFLLASFLAAKSAGVGLKRLSVCAALLIVCAAPWYTRNLIEAGDPAPPVFNMALYGKDAFVTRAELQAYAQDLFTKRSPKDLATLPLRAYFKPLTRDFREYGTCAVMLLLFAPMAIWLFLFGIGKQVSAAFSISAWTLTLLVLYWFLTSTLLRYSLIFYPLLPVSLAAAVAAALPKSMTPPRRKVAGVGLALMAAVLVLPSPVSHQYYVEILNSHYRFLPASYTSDDYYLDRFSPGYYEAQFAIATYKSKRLAGRVYALSVPLASYFRSHHIVSMGDWGGPAGFYRLYRAIDARRAAEFLAALDTSEALINTDMIMPGMYVPLRRQLLRARYREIKIPNSAFRLFVAPAPG